MCYVLIESDEMMRYMLLVSGEMTCHESVLVRGCVSIALFIERIGYKEFLSERYVV